MCGAQGLYSIISWGEKFIERSRVGKQRDSKQKRFQTSSSLQTAGKRFYFYLIWEGHISLWRRLQLTNPKKKKQKETIQTTKRLLYLANHFILPRRKQFLQLLNYSLDSIWDHPNLTPGFFYFTKACFLIQFCKKIFRSIKHSDAWVLKVHINMWIT